jgi:hypothetical protein
MPKCIKERLFVVAVVKKICKNLLLPPATEFGDCSCMLDVGEEGVNTHNEKGGREGKDVVI